MFDTMKLLTTEITLILLNYQLKTTLPESKIKQRGIKSLISDFFF